MKIYKRQTGGVVYNPFMGNTASPQAVAQPTNEKNDSEDEIQKAIVKVLEQNGVPNDVNAFLAQAKRLLAKRDFSLFSSGYDSYDMSDLIRLHSLANQIKWNSESANQAETQVINERAGSDVAINSDGNMYIWDDETKGIKLISPNTYAKNRSQYRPLTNNDLLYLRESMPELAFKNEIFIDLKNVIGINSIVDYMKGIISSFGTDTFKNNQSSYTIKHKGQIEKGFESILDGAAPDGIYKVKSTAETSDQGYNDEKSLLVAAQYLWSTLNPNMKNTLIAHTAAEGLDPNNPLDRYRLLITAIQEHTTHSRSYDVNVDYDASASKAEGIGNVGKEQQVIDTFGNWVQKNGGTYLTNDLVIEGANINFKTPAYHYNRIENSFNGEQVPVVMTGAETYQNMLGHGIVDTTRKVYFGDLPINNVSVTGDGILIDTFKGGRVVYLPVDTSGNVDFELYRIMNTIQEEIISDNITDPKHQQQIWEDNGFDYNPIAKVGAPKGYTLMRYWMQPASTSTAADIFDKKSLKGSNFIGKSSDSEKLENLGLKYNNDPLNKNKSKIDIAPGWFGEAYDGMLLIPMNYEQDEAMMAGKIAYTNKENVDNLNAYQQAVQRGNGYGPNRSINGLSSYDLD